MSKCVPSVKPFILCEPTVVIIILILQPPAPSYDLSKWNVCLCFRHAEQLPETICECGPEAHAAEASGVCHVQRRGRPVPPVPAPHPRFVVQVLCLKQVLSN